MAIQMHQIISICLSGSGISTFLNVGSIVLTILYCPWRIPHWSNRFRISHPRESGSLLGLYTKMICVSSIAFMYLMPVGQKSQCTHRCRLL